MIALSNIENLPLDSSSDLIQHMKKATIESVAPFAHCFYLYPLLYARIVSIFSYLVTMQSAEKLSLSLNSLGLASRRFIDMFRRVHGIIPVSIQTFEI